MANKKRILLIWDVKRADLLEPFISLEDDLEFIVLWDEEVDKKVKANSEHPFKEIFFQDFKTPYRLLNEVKPDKVLFFNIDTFPQVALNLASKNLGIQTFTMHHGIYSSNSLEINKKKEHLRLNKKKNLWNNNIYTLRFYLSALRFKNLNQVIKYLYFPIIRKRRNSVVALEKIVFEARLPTRLIQLSPYNAIKDKQIHHITSDERFVYIGHPFFDPLLKKLKTLENKTGINTEKYFLLIDFANTDNNIAFKSLTKEGKHQFYKKLSAIAKSLGYRLKIKLHPAGFDSPHNYEDDNIDLIYDTDIAPLILNAEKCFSFYSTLIIPIIYNKGFCYLFDFGMKIALQDELVELGVAKMLEINNFTAADLLAGSEKRNIEKYQTFIERYLYFTDGGSTERLKNILTADEVI